MPTYDYECRDCGGFDALRSLAQRNEPAAEPRLAASAAAPARTIFGMRMMDVSCRSSGRGF